MYSKVVPQGPFSMAVSPHHVAGSPLTLSAYFSSFANSAVRARGVGALLQDTGGFTEDFLGLELLP